MEIDRRQSSSPSLASLDRWRSQSPQGSQRRKLSFNPVGTWEPPLSKDVLSHDLLSQLHHTEPQISRAKRILQVIVAVVYCLFAAGVVFGFAALKPVLVAEGAYRETCTDDEIDAGVWVCYGQELRLNFMFTVAAVATNVCALPVGTILDRFGPRFTGIIGTVFLTLGSLLLAFAQRLPFDAYVPGYLLLAIGGPFVFISSFQLSNAFPAHSGLILALLTGAFDTSSAVFLVFRLIFQSTKGAFDSAQFFLIYLAVPVLSLLAQILIMPAKSYQSPAELANGMATNDGQYESVGETTGLLDHLHDDQGDLLLQEANRGGVAGAMHGKTVAQQLRSWWFVLVLGFTVVQMTRINYFVATLRTQYTVMLGSYDKAVTINEFFDLALPLGGVIAVPFIGALLDHTSTVFVFMLLVVTATLIGILGIIPQVWAAYANIVLFVIYRPLYYTAVSDYAAKVFGFETFGKVYGLIICLAGLFNFSQAGLDALTHRAFHDDPTPVNIILLSTTFVLGVALVGFIFRKSGQVRRDLLEYEAEHASEEPVPGATNVRPGEN